MIAHANASVNGVNGMMSAPPRTLLVASTGQSRGSGDLLPRLTALDVVSGAKSTVALVEPPHVAEVVYLRVSPDGRTWFVTGADVDEHNDQVAATWAIDWQSLDEFFNRLEKQGSGINVGTYVGATQVREMVLGSVDRQATPDPLSIPFKLYPKALAKAGLMVTKTGHIVSKGAGR